MDNDTGMGVGLGVVGVCVGCIVGSGMDSHGISGHDHSERSSLNAVSSQTPLSSIKNNSPVHSISLITCPFSHSTKILQFVPGFVDRPVEFSSGHELEQSSEDPSATIVEPSEPSTTKISTTVGSGTSIVMVVVTTGDGVSLETVATSSWVGFADGCFVGCFVGDNVSLFGHGNRPQVY